MPTSNRASLINKTVKIVKKHYKPAAIPPERTLFDHLLYACCLENSPHEAADQVFESLSRDYFDWNEVRVSTIQELSEVMKPLNDPVASATRLKRVLQSLFEIHYAFDLEAFKKQNIGQVVKQLAKYKGVTPFIIAFVTQNGLGGHAIPVNQGLLEALFAVGVISESEAAKGTVPGLERTISKSNGIEIGTLLHQLGVELHRSPYGPTIRKLLLEISPGCKARLPKRPAKKKPVQPEKKSEPSVKKPEKASSKKKTTAPKAKPASSKKTTVKKKPSTKPSESKKPVTQVKKKTVKKKTVKKKTKKKKVVPSRVKKKKVSNQRLAKRKPR